MGFSIITLKEQQENAKDMALWESDRRLWLDATRTKTVEEGDPAAAFLFCIAGESIPESEALKYGLIKKAEKPAVPAVEKPAKSAAKKEG